MDSLSSLGFSQREGLAFIELMDRLENLSHYDTQASNNGVSSYQRKYASLDYDNNYEQVSPISSTLSTSRRPSEIPSLGGGIGSSTAGSPLFSRLPTFAFERRLSRVTENEADLKSLGFDTPDDAFGEWKDLWRLTRPRSPMTIRDTIETMMSTSPTVKRDEMEFEEILSRFHEEFADKTGGVVRSVMPVYRMLERCVVPVEKTAIPEENEDGSDNMSSISTKSTCSKGHNYSGFYMDREEQQEKLTEPTVSERIATLDLLVHKITEKRGITSKREFLEEIRAAEDQLRRILDHFDSHCVAQGSSTHLLKIEEFQKVRQLLVNLLDMRMSLYPSNYPEDEQHSESISYHAPQQGEIGMKIKCYHDEELILFLLSKKRIIEIQGPRGDEIVSKISRKMKSRLGVPMESRIVWKSTISSLTRTLSSARDWMEAIESEYANGKLMVWIEL